MKQQDWNAEKEALTRSLAALQSELEEARKGQAKPAVVPENAAELRNARLENDLLKESVAELEKKPRALDDVDSALVLHFPGPHSATGEDVVELHPYIQRWC